MRKRAGFVAAAVGLIGLAALVQCTKAPLSEDHVADAGSLIQGQVSLANTNGEDVYVWLEGLNLSTRTDWEGRFVLEMPRGPITTNADGSAGVYKLYFYVANYTLTSADVVVRNGKFVEGEGDVGPGGELIRTINMSKILDIYTIVQPNAVNVGYRDGIDVGVRLRAVLSPVQVAFPKSVGGLLGGMLVRDLETGAVEPDIPDPGAHDILFEIVTITPKTRRMVFHLNGINSRALFLDPGHYEIIPYFLILQENMPSGLLASMGDNVTELTPEFLKIPTRRDGGLFDLTGVVE